MAFTLKPDGTIQTETAEELMQLIALQRRGAEPASPAPKASQSIAHPKPLLAEVSQPVHVADLRQAYRQFYAEIDDQQQRGLLRALLTTTRQLTDAELRHELNLKDNLGLRGSLIGIVRRAKNRNIPSPITKQMNRTNGGLRRAYRYGLTPDFRTAMEGYQFGEKMAV